MPSSTWHRLAPVKQLAVSRAAEAEFGARGYSGASLNVICRRAGISKGSLFQYFIDKADLYVFVAEQVSARVRLTMEAHVERLLEGRDAIDAIDDLTDAWVRYFLDNPGDCAMATAMSLEMDPSVRAAVQRSSMTDYDTVIRPLIQAAMTAGRLARGTDVDKLIELITVVLTHLATSARIATTAPDTPARMSDDTLLADSRETMRFVISAFTAPATSSSATSPSSHLEIR
jgi:AcrR family transcriptional regulator